MKIPKSFILEKNLDSATEKIKEGKAKDKNLDHLILCQKFFDKPVIHSESQLNTQSVYPFFKNSEISESLHLEYKIGEGEVKVNLLKLENETIISKNHQNIFDHALSGAETPIKADAIFGTDYSDKEFLCGNILIKDSYFIIIQTKLGDFDIREQFVNIYKKDFGFKEL